MRKSFTTSLNTLSYPIFTALLASGYGAVFTLHILSCSMAILELLYNKNMVVRTRRRKPDEYILMGRYRNGSTRRMHIEDHDTICIQEVRTEDRLRMRTIEHARLQGEEINRMGGVTGHIWGNFRHEYIWAPSEITPDD